MWSRVARQPLPFVTDPRAYGRRLVPTWRRPVRAVAENFRRYTAPTGGGVELEPRTRLTKSVLACPQSEAQRPISPRAPSQQTAATRRTSRRERFANRSLKGGDCPHTRSHFAMCGYQPGRADARPVPPDIDSSIKGRNLTIVSSKHIALPEQHSALNPRSTSVRHART